MKGLQKCPETDAANIVEKLISDMKAAPRLAQSDAMQVFEDMWFLSVFSRPGIVDS
ncbi:DNA gyrase subunit B [Nitrobacter sp. Nb-311A]|uniref:hypothetical protein n=1 Tax=unclassified Nitrobacter TaxID=2620411 RepID=UPI0000684B39|nr:MULTISPECIES: hypothetical protein [unclassified Nitrobacter]EAQ36961.1 DNA gyrase subunit B [Nitrobacter sp. Nb-311A]MCB1392927.1 hypothetical protein [Nitrobacter sp.]MCV0386876.1 hypothetical protein [Nitrobacter sp.]